MKLQASRSATLLKDRYQHRCFLANIAKFFRAPIQPSRKTASKKYVMRVTKSLVTKLMRVADKSM